LLLSTADFFPLDWIIFSVTMTMLFFATISGVMFTGVRILWIRLYRIKPQATAPLQLLLTSIILITAVIAMMQMMVTIAPYWTMFGSQEDCTILELTTVRACSVSTIGLLATRITLRHPIIGVIFQAGNLGFSLVFVLGAVYMLRLKAYELDPDYNADASDDIDDMYRERENESKRLLFG
jgi:LMBR1 domain-containing protein 1